QQGILAGPRQRLAPEPQVVLPTIQQAVSRLVGYAIDEQQPRAQVTVVARRGDHPLVEQLPASLCDLIRDAARVGVRWVDARLHEPLGGEARQLAVEVAR